MGPHHLDGKFRKATRAASVPLLLGHCASNDKGEGKAACFTSLRRDDFNHLHTQRTPRHLKVKVGAEEEESTAITGEV
jgi:hypothetical protein